MATSATKNASGTYDIYENGVKKTTGTAAILPNYGLSETQLTSAPTQTTTGAPQETFNGYYTTGPLAGQTAQGATTQSGYGTITTVPGQTQQQSGVYQATQPAPNPFSQNITYGAVNQQPQTQQSYQQSTPQQGSQQSVQRQGVPTQQLQAMPSIVDILTTTGQDSSFAARKQMAMDFGIQGYTGTADQNKQLKDKYLAAYEANKSKTAPDTGAQAASQLDQFFTETTKGPEQNPFQSFFDTIGGFNPIENALFTQLSQVLSAPQNTQSLTDFYKQEIAAQGIPELNMELADIKRIMDGTEDDIREEVEKAGGFATESQVQAMTGARNKTLLKRATYLADVLNAKNEYVDRIVDLTQADRKAVSEELDRKLGITKTLFDMSQSMTNAAKDNYNSIIKNTGYDALVGSITSQGELQAVAKSLGMTPKMLLQLGSIKTSAQKSQELDELNFQLSVDKFNEDKRQFGMQYALEQQKLANQQAANVVVSPYSMERSQRNLQSVGELMPKVSSKTVGVGSLGAYIPGTDARNFRAEVDTLKANIIAGELTAMREASKTGGALGAVSDQESARLSASLGALDTGQSPENFKKQLTKVKESIYRWNAQALSLGKGYDYAAMKNEGYSDEEIYNYLASH